MHWRVLVHNVSQNPHFPPTYVPVKDMKVNDAYEINHM